MAVSRRDKTHGRGVIRNDREARARIVQDRNLIALNEREIETFERLVYTRQHEQAGRALVDILGRVSRVFGAQGYPATPQAEKYLYTRLGAAIVALLADEKFTLVQSGFAALGLQQAIITAILEAGALENSDHLVRLIGTRDKTNPEKLNFPSIQQQLKLLLAYSLDSDITLDLESMFRQEPTIMLSAYLGMLNRYQALTANSHRRREQLLHLGAIFEHAKPQIEQLPALSTAWMNCMYGTSPDRHAIKRSLNLLARSFVASAVDESEIRGRPRRPLSDRPVMLVPLEHFRVPHVNYRTYAALIRRLGEQFRLVGAGTAMDFDDQSRKMFEQVVDFRVPDQQGFAPLVAALHAVKADVVYYPTLGIQWWWIPVSTVRLAPLQLMTMGVPATTHSPCMDYVVVEESWAGDPDCYSETLIHTRAGSTRFQKRQGSPPRKRNSTGKENGLLRIAVPSFLTKLNVPFMETCRQIAARSRVPLEWHFFAGMSGLHHVIAKRRIEEWMPGAMVYRYMDYPTYTEILGSCDLHLSTFPFGGTNTNLDSMQLGIPMVTLEGKEAHGQIDAGMLRRAGLPEWLITHSADEYIEMALKLIHTPKDRLKIRQQLLKTDINEIFAEGDRAAPDDFVAAICWLYENNALIQGSKKKVWTVPDREHFGQRADGKSLSRSRSGRPAR